MTPYDLIVQYREKMELPSDYAAAKKLGLTKAAISTVKGGKAFSNETAWKIAEVLDMDPAEAIAICELARAENSQDRERVAMWKKRFDAVTHSAASIFFASALLGAGKLTSQLCILW